MQYNERLKFIREAKNLTQSELAKAIGTSQKQYSKYETGINEMTVGKLLKACKALEISADYILGLPKYWYPPIG